jgi:hypothetical protein
VTLERGQGEVAAPLHRLSFRRRFEAERDGDATLFVLAHTEIGRAFRLKSRPKALSSRRRQAGRVEHRRYAATTFHKIAQVAGGHKTGTASGSFSTSTLTGHWRSTAAITRITLRLAAGNFVTGTTATLYGLRD